MEAMLEVVSQEAEHEAGGDVSTDAGATLSVLQSHMFVVSGSAAFAIMRSSITRCSHSSRKPARVKKSQVKSSKVKQSRVKPAHGSVRPGDIVGRSALNLPHHPAGRAVQRASVGRRGWLSNAA